jgi:hypothetical protein
MLTPLLLLPPTMQWPATCEHRVHGMEYWTSDTGARAGAVMGGSLEEMRKEVQDLVWQRPVAWVACSVQHRSVRYMAYGIVQYAMQYGTVEFTRLDSFRRNVSSPTVACIRARDVAPRPSGHARP